MGLGFMSKGCTVLSLRIVVCDEGSGFRDFARFWVSGQGLTV